MLLMSAYHCYRTHISLFNPYKCRLAALSISCCSPKFVDKADSLFCGGLDKPAILLMTLLYTFNDALLTQL